MMQSNNENLPPQTLRQITKQIEQIVSDPPEGIKLHPNEKDITELNASVEGPGGTPYADGYFKLKILFGKNFPSEPPKAFFLTKIFHPNVASNGEICVNTLKKDWKASLGLKHILLTIKCLLIVPNPESALNEEAGKLLLEQYNDYCMRAKMYTDIHAKPTQILSERNEEEPNAKKYAADKSILDKRKKDKKRVLKRL